MRNVCVMLDHKLMLDMLREYSRPLQCTLSRNLCFTLLMVLSFSSYCVEIHKLVILKVKRVDMYGPDKVLNRLNNLLP